MTKIICMAAAVLGLLLMIMSMVILFFTGQIDTGLFAMYSVMVFGGLILAKLED